MYMIIFDLFSSYCVYTKNSVPFLGIYIYRSYGPFDEQPFWLNVYFSSF